MASMFTSRLPGAAGVTALEDSAGRRDILVNSCSALPLEATTVAEVLEEAGRMDDAVVIFTADHGEELWARDRTGHGLSMHHSETDIPLILFGVGVPAGRREELVRGLDVAPTILELAGVEPPASFTGVSLLGRSSAPLPAVSEDIAYGFETKALEYEGWKVEVDRCGVPVELYDRHTDPGQTRSLVEAEAGRSAALADQLATILAASDPADRRGLDIDEQTKEQLRSLGY